MARRTRRRRRMGQPLGWDDLLVRRRRSLCQSSACDFVLFFIPFQIVRDFQGLHAGVASRTISTLTSCPFPSLPPSPPPTNSLHSFNSKNGVRRGVIFNPLPPTQRPAFHASTFVHSPSSSPTPSHSPLSPTAAKEKEGAARRREARANRAVRRRDSSSRSAASHASCAA